MPQSELISICCKCKKELGRQKVPEGLGGISHGYCPECAADLMRLLDREFPPPENAYSVRRAYGGPYWMHKDGLD
jgi:hypothetical protein